MKEKINQINKSLLNAGVYNSKLNSEILNYPGFTSHKIKHYLNNLMELPNINYLEIGLWTGSTFIASLYKNNLNSVYAIDIKIKPEFDEITQKLNLNFIKFESDCFNFDLSNIKHKINVYFFDGEHTYEDQYKAIEYYYPILDDEFILLVDDWRMRNETSNYVEEGTRDAIKKLNLKILYENISESFGNDANNWWNGFYTGILKK
jgi:hypothetical protein